MDRRRMRARLAPVAALIALIMQAPVQVTASDPVRVMPLGDSITDGAAIPGGYRVRLGQLLGTTGVPVDFVGTLQNGPAELADRDHEGHSGSRIDQLAAEAAAWVHRAQPDVVLLLAGTNDIWQRHGLAGAPQRLLGLLTSVHRAAPEARIVVSTLPPCPDRAIEREQFNAALPAVVAEARAAGIPALLTPAGSALTVDDLYDGVHPNASGHEKLAAGFYHAVRVSTT